LSHDGAVRQPYQSGGRKAAQHRCRSAASPAVEGKSLFKLKQFK
jgi:hypothetical protein